MATIHTTSSPTNGDGKATKRFVDVHLRVDITGGKQTSRAKIEHAVAKLTDQCVETFKEQGMNASIDQQGSRFAFGYGPWFQGSISE